MEPAANASPIPVHVVTGFLGSGKTTLIAQLIRHPGLVDTAIIINEFGEIGLDHALIEAVDQEVILLARGCLCCALNGSLASTLETLMTRRANADLPPFRRILVETTGLADPAPVLATILDRPALLHGLTLGAVITVIDAAIGPATLDRYAEARRQAAIADTLLLSKTDLAPNTDPLRTRLAALNPRAAILESRHGAAPVATLFNPGPPRPRRYADSPHAAGLATLFLPLPHPLPFDQVADWLGTLVQTHGPALLRVKGLLAIAGQSRPLAVDGVQHVFHPPRLLPAWPPGIPPGLVFITDGLDPALIHASAEATFPERTAA